MNSTQAISIFGLAIALAVLIPKFLDRGDRKACNGWGTNNLGPKHEIILPQMEEKILEYKPSILETGTFAKK